MLANDYPAEDCSIARALELVGERWTMLIVRDAFLGVRRFEDFRDSLGVARNVLSSRLERLVDAGVLERRPYQERPERFEYVLTSKGAELWGVLMSLMKWGDRYYAPDGPPMIAEHRGCGGNINDRRICEACGAHLQPWEATARRRTRRAA